MVEDSLCVTSKCIESFLPTLVRTILYSLYTPHPYHTHTLLANHTGSVVFCVNYRKAPEHPFPAGQLDVFDSTLYLFQNASKYGFDPNEVIFTGDSAGGFLSINCWYRFHLSNYHFRPKGISLLYPALGYTLDTPR